MSVSGGFEEKLETKTNKDLTNELARALSVTSLILNITKPNNKINNY